MEPASFIDIRDVLRGIARRWLGIALFTAACAFLSYWFVSTVKPVYTAQSQVLIANQDSPYTSVGQDRLERRPVSERDIASQVQVVLSRDLALRVIEDLKLKEMKEFDSLKSGLRTVRKLMIWLGFKPDPRTMSEEQRVMDHYFDKLSAFEVPVSSVITIKFESRDPELAMKVANKVAENYVSFSRETLAEPTGEAREWLASQIESLRRKVVDAETTVERFRAEAGIFLGAKAKLNNEELSSLNSQIILASAARSEAEAKAASIRELLKRTGAVDTSSDVLNSSLIQRLREQQVRLTRSKAELSTIYLENHPRIIAVNRELKDLNRQIRNEAFKVVERLEQDAKVAAVRENALRQNLDQLKQQTNENSIEDVKLRELEREAAANRSLLESFLARYTDANARQDVSGQPSLGRVISTAGTPSVPSFPKKVPIMLLATLGSFMLALGLAFVVEVLGAAGRVANVRNPRASIVPTPVTSMAVPAGTPSGVRVKPIMATSMAPSAQMPPTCIAPFVGGNAAQSSAVHVPSSQDAAAALPTRAPVRSTSGVIATLPSMQTSMLAMHATNQALFDTASVYRRALEPIAADLDHLVEQHHCKRLAIVNLTGQVMDSVALSLGLGRLLSMRGIKTVLIDAGLGRVGIQNLATGASAKGVYDLAAGSVKFGDAIRKDTPTSLQLMAPGTNVPTANALDAVTNEKVHQIIRALEQVCQVCLVHLGEGNERNVDLAATSQVVLVIAPQSRLSEANEICAALKSGRVVKQAEVIQVAVGSNCSSSSPFRNVAASL
jgi:uncharacterized protein involved in exopolysaccharide biosynthesis